MRAALSALGFSSTPERFTSSSASQGRVGVPAAAIASGSRQPSRVGRGRERALLRDHLAAALAGRGGLVLLGGEAGIGKTALAEGLCREAAERGALALVGRCYDLSETPPYGPWAEALARAPRDADLPTLPAAVLPPERGGAVLASRE